MCGISGGYEVERDVVEKMVSSTAHRGPDATQIISVDKVTFGHNRLAVIDTSSSANQPMLSPDGRHILVFNGEIYNFKELRNRLSGWDFKSQGDSEVLLAALSTWGEKTLKEIKGIFAFAWYDLKKDQLLLVRDQLGAKPLYYAQMESSLIFSSELCGAIAGSDFRALDIESVSKFISMNYVPSPDTLVSGIKKIRAGHLVRFSRGCLKVERYFYPKEPKKKSVSKEEIRDTIGAEVSAQLVSDRPLGVFLSGGLDSSIVLHHASAETNIKTFSTAFEMVPGSESQSERFNSDADLAKKTAQIYGSNHTTFNISITDIQKDLISVLSHLDEPVSNPTAVSQYMLSKLVRDAGVVVALGGDGGDEMWGGYVRYRAALIAEYYHKSPHFIRQIVSSVYPRAAKLDVSLGADIHKELMVFPADKVNRVLRKKITNDAPLNLLKERYEEPTVSGLSSLESFIRVDRESWLADDSLHRTDRTSMAAGVEARVPLLGLPVVNLADSIHDKNKFTVLTAKKMLRQAYRGHLPEYLFNQPKRGWLSPGAKWFRDSDIEAQVRSIFSDSYYSGLSNFVDWSAVQEMLTDHIETKGYHLNPLWNLLTLQIWARKNNIII